MTLRARLALLVGALTAAAVAAVAAGGYQATAGKLASEVDSQLRVVAVQLGDPDGRSARSVCLEVGRRSDREGALPVGENRLELTIQCIDANGLVVVTSDAGAIPVESTDTDVALLPAGKTAFRTIRKESDKLRVVTVSVDTRGVAAIQLGRSLGGNEHVLSELRVQYLALVIGVSALAAALGWLLTRRATAPIQRLTKATEQVATTGQLDIDVPTEGRDETGRLARSFSTMLDGLRQSREQQQRLVQDAGHELRTPLTSLRANVDTLRRHPGLAGEHRTRLLADLDSELRELTSLTDELVALASATGNDEPTAPVDLADLVRRSVERVQRRSDRLVSVDAWSAPHQCQPRLMQRAIDNLFDNAAKFSPPHTPIEVVVRPGYVQVRDHGPGVAPEDLAHVFDRFYRSLSARALPGSGLGLSIVQDVVANHGGRVTVADHPAGGAIFTIHLPVNAQDRPADWTEPRTTPAPAAPPVEPVDAGHSPPADRPLARRGDSSSKAT